MKFDLHLHFLKLLGITFPGKKFERILKEVLYISILFISTRLIEVSFIDLIVTYRVPHKSTISLNKASHFKYL